MHVTIVDFSLMYAFCMTIPTWSAKLGSALQDETFDFDRDPPPTEEKGTSTARGSHCGQDLVCWREAASFVARVAAAFGERAILSEVLAEHWGVALAQVAGGTGWNGHLPAVRLLGEKYGVNVNASTAVEMVECTGIECIGRNGREGNGATAVELAMEIWGTAETERAITNSITDALTRGPLAPPTYHHPNPHNIRRLFDAAFDGDACNPAVRRCQSWRADTTRNAVDGADPGPCIVRDGPRSLPLFAAADHRVPIGAGERGGGADGPAPEPFQRAPLPP